MCFRCGLEDHLITNGLKPETLDKKLHWNTEKPKTRAYISKKIDNTSEDSTDEIKSQNIYAYMVQMSINAEIIRKKHGYSSQLINWILDSGVICHTTP